MQEGVMLHAQFRSFGALGLVSAMALLTACGGGGSSMNTPPMTAAPPSSSNSTSTTPPAVKQAQAANTAVDPAIVTADNGFGVSLLKNLAAGATANVCIAPICNAMATLVGA